MTYPHDPYEPEHGLYRSDDPDTSRMAGDELLDDPERLGALQARAAKAVLDRPNCTTNELATSLGDLDLRTIGRRISELLDHGVIHVSGVRACRVTGKQARTYAHGPGQNVRAKFAKMPPVNLRKRIAELEAEVARLRAIPTCLFCHNAHQTRPASEQKDRLESSGKSK